MSDYDEPNFDIDDIDEIELSDDEIELSDDEIHDSNNDNSDSGSEIEEIVDDFNDITQSDSTQRTINRLTKYEYVNILGTRAQQIARGAKIFVSLDGMLQEDITPVNIAKLEMIEGKIPLKIKRTIPNGGIEYITIKKKFIF
jgi:DNA-directed RNA polymerase subunit K/omega